MKIKKRLGNPILTPTGWKWWNVLQHCSLLYNWTTLYGRDESDKTQKIWKTICYAAHNLLRQRPTWEWTRIGERERESVWRVDHKNLKNICCIILMWFRHRDRITYTQCWFRKVRCLIENTQKVTAFRWRSWGGQLYRDWCIMRHRNLWFNSK